MNRQQAEGKVIVHFGSPVGTEYTPQTPIVIVKDVK